MSRRGIVATSVLAAWAAGLGLLFARELNPSPAARLADVALRIVPITTYYIAEDAGRHVGFASIAIDTVPRALQVTEYVVTESPAGVRRTEQLAVHLSRGLSMRDFTSTSTRGTDTTRVIGRIADSTLVFSAGTSESIPVSLPAFAGVIGATVTILLDEPRVGSTSIIRTIDPATGKSSERATRIDAESLFVVVDSAIVDSSGRWSPVHRDTVRAWRLVATDAPALDAWIDAQGLVVESRLPNGLLLRRTAFELAFENWRQAHPERAVSARGDGSVISGTWLASGATRPTQALDSLQVRFGASIPREFSTRYSRNYRAGGQVSYARTPEARLRSRYTLPTSDAWQKVFRKELSPGPSIESDDPSISRRAARLAAKERDPAVIARRIVGWVHDSLRAESGASPLSALGAVTRRSGDAREFALLTTALARAAGVPAQPVSGLLQHDGRFYLHAWTEVYLGRWVPVDAMLDQFPADASHIPFMTGTADPGPDLARILSRMELSVIRASRVQ
ncbi:MAG TPA: transglutaminase-like domain-containing protein [Gemmatimonadaceae bacterium]